MGSLLKQNWFIIRKNILLWLILIVLFLGSAWAAYDFYSELGMMPGLGIVYAFFAAVFIGDAGSGGRLQNNIISGFSRVSIYTAYFLVLLFCCVLMVAAAMLGDLAGAEAAGRPENYEPQRMILLFISLCINAAGYAGMFALTGLLLTGRRSGRGTIMLIICCCIFVVIGIWGGNIENALWEPEMVTYYDAQQDVGTDLTQISYPDETDPEGPAAYQEPNPAYIAEPLRSQYEAIAEFLPVTQSVYMLQLLSGPDTGWPDVYSRMYTLWCYAGILAVCTTAAGILFFRRRDLN